MRSILICLSLVVGFPTASVVRAEDPLEGKRVVVIRDEAPLEVDGKEVRKVSQCSVFTGKTVQGNFLWIEAEKAYLRRADVVPFEDAIDHYTRQVEAIQLATAVEKADFEFRFKLYTYNTSYRQPAPQ